MEDWSREDLLNEIKDLEDSVRFRDALITAKDKENRQLRLQLESADRVGAKYASKIRDLEADKRRLYDLEDEYRKEISKLREAVAELGGVISKKNSEINRLEADLASVEDYSDKQADVIRLYLNEVKQLRASKQNSNDSRKFYWAYDPK